MTATNENTNGMTWGEVIDKSDPNTPTTVTIPSAGDAFVAHYADTLGAFLDGNLTASQYLSAKGA